MEEYERSILLAHRHELDRFPASIGTDDDGAGGADDLGWETIEHPAAEVLGAFGDGGGGGGKRGRRKRPAVITARELARALSGGKRPRGGGGRSQFFWNTYLSKIVILLCQKGMGGDSEISKSTRRQL